MKKKVLITGITGQDGSFLTKYMLENNDIEIFGTSRNDNHKPFFKTLEYLKVDPNNLNRLKIFKIDFHNFDDVNSFIKNNKFDMVYNLMGPASVYESLQYPLTNSKSIIVSFNNLVEALIQNNSFPSFFQTSSSEMFDDNNGISINEESYFNPKSPYATSKLFIHNMINFLRKKYDWTFVSGILFNHESELRSDNYLIMKIINDAIEIKNKNKKKLVVGGVDIIRDWGFAGDHTLAMKLIMENNLNGNYVIGTGEGNSIERMIEIVFDYFNLDFENNLDINPELLRKNEPKIIIANPKKLMADTGWKPSINFQELVIRCIKFKIKN